MKMKIKNKRAYQLPITALIFPPVTIARFGPARLIRHFDGRHELIGGTAEHQANAREWCSLFAPQVVFSDGGSPHEALPSARIAIAFAE